MAVACAKFCSDIITRNEITAKAIDSIEIPMYIAGTDLRKMTKYQYGSRQK